MLYGWIVNQDQSPSKEENHLKSKRAYQVFRTLFIACLVVPSLPVFLYRSLFTGANLVQCNISKYNYKEYFKLLLWNCNQLNKNQRSKRNLKNLGHSVSNNFTVEFNLKLSFYGSHNFIYWKFKRKQRWQSTIYSRHLLYFFQTKRKMSTNIKEYPRTKIKLFLSLNYFFQVFCNYRRDVSTQDYFLGSADLVKNSDLFLCQQVVRQAMTTPNFWLNRQLTQAFNKPYYMLRTHISELPTSKQLKP